MTRPAGFLAAVAVFLVAAVSAQAAPRPAVHHASAAVDGTRTFELIVTPMMPSLGRIDPPTDQKERDTKLRRRPAKSCAPYFWMVRVHTPE